LGGDDAWAGVAAGGGAREPAPAVSGGGRGEAEREAVVPEVEEAGRSQKDLFVIYKKCGDLSVN
jgi:hypothetical protein